MSQHFPLYTATGNFEPTNMAEPWRVSTHNKNTSVAQILIEPYEKLANGNICIKKKEKGCLHFASPLKCLMYRPVEMNELLP